MRRSLIFIFIGLVLALTAGVFVFGSRSSVVVPLENGPARATSTPPVLAETRLMFVGDIMLARNVGKIMEREGDYKFPFLKIAEVTRSADIAFANLETTVSDRGRKIGSIYSFRSDPRSIEGLTHAGFDVVSLANNHIWDYAEEAFMDTQMHLANAGIAYTGGGPDHESAHRPAIIERNGVRFAYLAYTDLLPAFFTRTTANPASAGHTPFSQVERDIERAREQADVVIVSYHWGTEYETKHNAEQESLAKATIDAGAKLVIGHHPHVQQEIEAYKDGWIAYSLGNFVFDQYFQPEVMQSRIFEVTFKGKDITGTRDIPVVISRQSQPDLAENLESGI